MLDIAVILAENWLMIVVAPIIAGTLAFGVLTQVTPREYTSEALLRIDANEAALLKTARVLDEPLRESALFEQQGSIVSEARRTLLDDHLTVLRQEDTGFYAVQVRLGTPEAARTLLSDIVNSLIARSAPTERKRALLVLRREQSQSAITEMEASIRRFNAIATRLSQSGQIDSNSALEALGNSRECHELCVSGLAHAGLRYTQASKRPENIIANWLRAATHSRTLRPPFSKFRIAR